MTVTRRDILKISSLYLGYAATGGVALSVLKGCRADTSERWEPAHLTTDMVKLVDAIADMIIPETDTPGAKSAFIGRFVDAMMDTVDADMQAYVLSALTNFDLISNEVNGTAFIKSGKGGQRKVFDTMIAEIQSDHNKDDAPPHIFHIMKEATIFGFFTSEVGAKQCLIYDPKPGEQIGCMEYSDVGGTWFENYI